MKIKPEEIAVMTFEEKMIYLQNLESYAIAVKFQQYAINTTQAALGIKLVPESAPVQLPASVQEDLKELENYKLKEKVEAAVAAQLQKMDEIRNRQIRNQAPKETSHLEQLMEFVVTMWILERLKTLDSPKEGASLMYTADFNIEADKLESLQQILEPKLMAEQTGMAYLKMRIDSVEKTFGS